MHSEVLSVNAQGLNSIKLSEVYEAALELKKLGAKVEIYVDDRVFKSSLSPKKKLVLKTGRPPIVVTDLEGLQMAIGSIKALKQAEAAALVYEKEKPVPTKRRRASQAKKEQEKSES